MISLMLVNQNTVSSTVLTPLSLPSNTLDLSDTEVWRYWLWQRGNWKSISQSLVTNCRVQGGREKKLYSIFLILVDVFISLKVPWDLDLLRLRFLLINITFAVLRVNTVPSFSYHLHSLSIKYSLQNNMWNSVFQKYHVDKLAKHKYKVRLNEDEKYWTMKVKNMFWKTLSKSKFGKNLKD